MTVQCAAWVMRLGTLLRRNFLLPLMPAFPTTITSACSSAATATIASAGWSSTTTRARPLGPAICSASWCSSARVTLRMCSSMPSGSSLPAGSSWGRGDDLDQEELGGEPVREVGCPLDGPLRRLGAIGGHEDSLHGRDATRRRVRRRREAQVWGLMDAAALVADWAARGSAERVGDDTVFVVDTQAVRTGAAPPLLVLHGYPRRRSTSRPSWARSRPSGASCSSTTRGSGSRRSPTVRTRSSEADAWRRSSPSLGIEEVDLLTHDLGDSVGGELLARGASTATWGSPCAAGCITNGSIYMHLVQLSDGSEAAGVAARRDERSRSSRAGRRRRRGRPDRHARTQGRSDASRPTPCTSAPARCSSCTRAATGCSLARSATRGAAPATRTVGPARSKAPGAVDHRVGRPRSDRGVCR